MLGGVAGRTSAGGWPASWCRAPTAPRPVRYATLSAPRTCSARSRCSSTSGTGKTIPQPWMRRAETWRVLLRGAPSSMHPLTAPEVAALSANVGERYPVYELLVLFMAYTGLRAAEVQGLEVRDLVLTTTATGSVRGSVRVQRTKSRRKREWVTGTPRSKTSKRTVPPPPWLAAKLAAYLGIRAGRRHTYRGPLAASATRLPCRKASARLVSTSRPQRPQDRPPSPRGNRPTREPASLHR